MDFAETVPAVHECSSDEVYQMLLSKFATEHASMMLTSSDGGTEPVVYCMPVWFGVLKHLMEIVAPSLQNGSSYLDRCKDVQAAQPIKQWMFFSVTYARPKKAKQGWAGHCSTISDAS